MRLSRIHRKKIEQDGVARDWSWVDRYVSISMVTSGAACSVSDLAKYPVRKGFSCDSCLAILAVVSTVDCIKEVLRVVVR